MNTKMIVKAVVALSFAGLVACGQASSPVKKTPVTNPNVNPNNTTTTCNEDDTRCVGLTLQTCLNGTWNAGTTCDPGTCVTDNATTAHCAAGGGGGGGTTGGCTVGTCTDIQGGSVCLDNGNVPADAPTCDADTGEGCDATMTPVGVTDASGQAGCVCLQQCTSTGGGGGGGGGGTATCTECTDDSVCGDGVTAGCWLSDSTGTIGYCASDCTDADNCPTGTTCQPDSGDSYSTCVPDVACGGGGGGGGGGGTATCTECTDDSVCGDGVTAGCWLSDSTGTIGYCAFDCTDADNCPTGTTCQPDSGDSYSTCVPDVACDGSTGGGGGGGGGTSTCTECTDDSTCGDGVTAGCWLSDSTGTIGYCAFDCTDADNCPTGTTCQPDTGDSYSTCVPDVACDGSTGGGGGTTGTCPAGECTAITGGSICLDNGDIPAGSGSCDAATGEGCSTDTVPVTYTDDAGADACVCLYEC